VVGAAYMMAEANGELQNPAFMGQIAELVMCLETLRACIRCAKLDPESRLPTMVIPNPVALDVAVNTITAEYYRMLKVLRDLAGGSVTTNQSVDILESPESGRLDRACLRRCNSWSTAARAAQSHRGPQRESLRRP
jgi:aromatic ring hydroxylase